MRRKHLRVSVWIVVGILVSMAGYVVAEEITMTTYYPSPRGVYDELSANKVGIGTISPGVELDVDGQARIFRNNAGTIESHATLIINAQDNPEIWMDDVGHNTGGFGILGSTGMVFATEKGILFRTGSTLGGGMSSGTTRLTIEQSGDVGIGTTNPGTMLDVRGGIYALNGLPSILPSVNGYGFCCTENFSDTGMFSDEDGTLRFYANNGQAFIIKNHPPNARIVFHSGYHVGVGIDPEPVLQPLARLHVVRGAASTSFRVDDTGYNDSTPFFIGADGKVGIGTATPSSKLEVAGNIDVEGQARIFRNNAGTIESHATLIINAQDNPEIWMDDVGHNTGGFGILGSTGMVFATEKGILFRTGSTLGGGMSSGTTQLTIEQLGDVGIGVTNPTAKLHIEQANASDAMRVDDQAGDTTPFVINADGEVGIGTTTPSSKLEVFGNIELGSVLYFGLGTSETAIRKNSGFRLELGRGDFSAGANVVPPVNDTGKLGIVGQRWGAIHVNNHFVGDLIFENDYRFTELPGDEGLILLSDKGVEVARYTDQKSPAAIFPVMHVSDKLLLSSPDGSCFQVTVDDNGALSATSAACP